MATEGVQDLPVRVETGRPFTSGVDSIARRLKLGYKSYVFLTGGGTVLLASIFYIASPYNQQSAQRSEIASVPIPTPNPQRIYDQANQLVEDGAEATERAINNQLSPSKRSIPLGPEHSDSMTIYAEGVSLEILTSILENSGR